MIHENMLKEQKNCLTKQLKLEIVVLFKTLTSVFFPLLPPFPYRFQLSFFVMSFRISFPLSPLTLTISLFFLSLCFSSLTHAEGRLEVNMSEVSLEAVERFLLQKDPSIASGGYWKPKDCLPRWKASVDETLLTGLFTEKHWGIHRWVREGGHIMQMLPCSVWGVTEWFWYEIELYLNPVEHREMVQHYPRQRFPSTSSKHQIEEFWKSDVHPSSSETCRIYVKRLWSTSDHCFLQFVG